MTPMPVRLFGPIDWTCVTMAKSMWHGRCLCVLRLRVCAGSVPHRSIIRGCGRPGVLNVTDLTLPVRLASALSLPSFPRFLSLRFLCWLESGSVNYVESAFAWRVP